MTVALRFLDSKIVLKVIYIRTQSYIFFDRIVYSLYFIFVDRIWLSPKIKFTYLLTSYRVVALNVWAFFKQPVLGIGVRRK